MGTFLRAAAIVVLASELSASAQGDPAAVARAFYTRFAAGDLAGAAALWVPEQRDAFTREHARALRLRCRRLVRLELAAGTSSTIDATAELMEWTGDPSRPWLVTRSDNLLLRFERGEWRIAALMGREPGPASFERAQTLTVRAMTAINERRIGDAAALAATAAAVAEDAGDLRALALVRGVESVLARQRDADSARSNELAEQAVALAEQSGDPDVIVRAMLRLIRARTATDKETIPHLVEKALAMTDRVVDLSAAALVATQAAIYYDNLPSPREALAYSLTAERLAEESGDVSARISAQMNLGGAHRRKNDCYLAVPHYERALELSRAAGFSATTAEILGNLAACARGNGEAQRAARMMDESVALLDASNLSTGRLGGIIHRAFDLARDGKFDAAEAELERARTIAAGGPSSATDFVTFARGALRVMQKRYAEGMAIWSAADHVLAAKPRVIHAVGLRGVGRHAEAEEELRAYIESADDFRPVISTDYRQVLTFTDFFTPAYQELVDLLVECGRPAEALDVYERHRARVLRELLAGGGVAGTQRLTAAERRRVADLEQRIAGLARGNTSDREEELAAARLELAKVTARAFADDPDARWPVQPTPPPVQTLEMDAGTTYVAFCVGAERTVRFVVTRDRRGRASVSATFIPIVREDLRQRVSRFTRQIETRDFAIGRAAEELYALLLGGLQPSRILSFVPDDVLWQLPFHALGPGRGSYVIERARVSYAPSIAAIPSPGTHAGGTRIVALGDPKQNRETSRLPGAAAETALLRRFYGTERSRIALREHATESMVKQAGEYDVLHIAAHAVVDRNRPLHSALLLSAADSGEDGYLEAREIASLDLRGRLVVLAACETGLGRPVAAEGVVGLPWAVLAAGARATLLSLWKTDSTSTADTMVEFHRQYARGQPPDQALRTAQLAMLAKPRYRHPLYWAPFVVIHGIHDAVPGRPCM